MIGGGREVPLKLCQVFLSVTLISALACAPLPPAPTAASRAEFRRLCQAVGSEGGKLSREKFLAQAKDQEAAARLFDACDVNRDGVITEEEARPDYLESLKGQAIRLTTPTPPTTRGF